MATTFGNTGSQTGHDTDGISADYDRGASPAANLGGGTSPAAGATAFGDNRDGLGRDRTDAVMADEDHKLISADKVVGTAVYNGQGERLGTVDSIMLNKRSGRVAYAVLSFGGFLGIGEKYHPLPWDKLTYDEDKGGYNVDMGTAGKLAGAPNYSRDELSHLDYGNEGGKIRGYYGTDIGAHGGSTGAFTPNDPVRSY